MADIVIPRPPALPFYRVREAIARLIRAVAPAARVNDEWLLKFDLTASVAPITVQTVEDAADPRDLSHVHSWMVGVDAIDYVRLENGQVMQVGGGEYDYNVTFAVWGFFDYQLAREINGQQVSSQRVAEEEVDLVAAVVAANQTLALDDDTGLRSVGVLSFSPLDVVSFSDGVDVHVAQGSMVVRIERVLF